MIELAFSLHVRLLRRCQPIIHAPGARRFLGVPVPCFSAPTIKGGAFDLHVSAGRWVVLSFLGSPNNPRALTEITELVRACAPFDENHIVVACVFTGRPNDV